LEFAAVRRQRPSVRDEKRADHGEEEAVRQQHVSVRRDEAAARKFIPAVRRDEKTVGVEREAVGRFESAVVGERPSTSGKLASVRDFPGADSHLEASIRNSNLSVGVLEDDDGSNFRTVRDERISIGFFIPADGRDEPPDRRLASAAHFPWEALARMDRKDNQQRVTDRRRREVNRTDSFTEEFHHAQTNNRYPSGHCNSQASEAHGRLHHVRPGHRHRPDQ
jgi:hypothetical protein